ncbi:MAG TPA: amino acid ABC transporter ATP-binding protein [Candidatus Polarisedimenticolia bacterium]|nr:amino acid ABC transporter ATP-binding protein [Candidatus Polarisedimenticolia bacterium]
MGQGDPVAGPVGDLRLTLTEVSKRFGESRVLDGVNLTVGPGETVALIGPSGGGKSTVLRCINGLTTFDAGSIRVGPVLLSPVPGGRGGSDGEAARRVRRLVGMIFQDFQLFPHLTAIENIIEAPVRVLGQRRTAAIENAFRLLKRVGLEEHGEHYPRQLSGGQKQRVAIARALAMSPRALLCDEITSALDPELKHEVLQVLEGLKRDGITLMVVTHEIGFARRAADRVVVLESGRIIEDGPPAEVLDRPKMPRTRQFLSQILA